METAKNEMLLTGGDNYFKRNMGNRHTRNDAEVVNEKWADWYYQMIDVGMNYRMTDIQATLIASQLDKLEIFKKRRKQIVSRYNEALKDVPGIILQQEIPESDTARHLYIIQIDESVLNISRREFFEALKAENVRCNVHYIPVYYLPYYHKLGYKRGLCLNAEKLYKRIISIPLYYAMTDDDVESVICAVKKIAEAYMNNLKGEYYE